MVFVYRCKVRPFLLCIFCPPTPTPSHREFGELSVLTLGFSSRISLWCCTVYAVDVIGVIGKAIKGTKLFPTVTRLRKNVGFALVCVHLFPQLEV